ncbi:UNVERIFIED_CONTAM: Techylectin-like protein [Trichonephila clavipes]
MSSYVIQRRGDFKRPADFFLKPWQSYKAGFGDLRRDFWLGSKEYDVFKCYYELFLSQGIHYRELMMVRNFQPWTEITITARITVLKDTKEPGGMQIAILPT